MSKLVIGCGYLGLRVAKRWLSQGQTVYATTRSPQRAAEFQQLGIHPVVVDITEPSTLSQPSTLSALPPDVSTVLFAVGFDRTSGHNIDEVYVQGLRNVLPFIPTGCRLIYISSTGVYGDADGEWVDEDSPCHPTRPGGKACLAAEKLLLEHSIASRTIILRLAGIYGSERVPRKDDLLNGTRQFAGVDGYLNLIHVDDAVSVIDHCQSMKSIDDLPKIFLVADGHPVRRRDYYMAILEMLGIRADEVATLMKSEGGRGSKRIRTTIWRQLGLQPRFPTYREGLEEILGGG